MKIDFSKQLKLFINRNHNKRIWYKIVCALACVVVFCTTYALILPVITKEKVLNCTEEALSGHVHTRLCKDENYNLVCGYADFVIHSHDPEKCFDNNGVLICSLEEISEHRHDENCYTIEKVLVCDNTDEDHEHTEECFEEQKLLTCDKPEAILHEHTDECFDKNGKLICGMTQVLKHEHTDKCYEKSKSVISASDDAGDTKAVSSTIDLKEYILSRDGSFTLVLFDKNGQLLNGGEVYVGDQYKLSLGVGLHGDGFEPGTYTYQLPGSLRIDPKTNIPVTNNAGEQFGSWSVDEQGFITFEFYENSNQQQNVAITIDMSFEFVAEDEQIDFDGNVYITVKKQPEELDEPESYVYKSGRINADNTISWSIEFQGNSENPLVGQTVTDELIGIEHEYTAGNKYAWAEVYYEDASGEWKYYSWRVSEPDAQWTDTGWTYVIPETITCLGCSNHTGTHTVALQNNWICYFYFKSTITDADATRFGNKVTVGDKEYTANVRTTTNTGIVKNGRLENGEFVWDVSFDIPGGNETTYYWYMWDAMDILLADGGRESTANDIHLGLVTATYNGQEIVVPDTDHATADDPFCWETWAESDESSGREMDIMHRCECTADTCIYWENGKCATRHWKARTHCRCWHEADPVAFRIRYTTQASADIIGAYGGNSAEIQNYIYLYDKEYKDGSWVNTEYAVDHDEIPIPGTFYKHLITEPSKDNQYIADFQITVNESYADLSNSDNEIVITDTMSDTLFYSSGSMHIIQSDAEGDSVVLTEDKDYTIEVSDDYHVLNITLSNPGAYKYTLKYSAAVNVSGRTGPIPYTNTAEIELWGKKYTSVSAEEHLTEYTSTAETFRVAIAKTDDTSVKLLLEGAEFGLYTEDGNRISTGLTDSVGYLAFQTDIRNGIIFQKNVPYYIQEIKAPIGYKLNDTKYWFYFADSDDADLIDKYPDIKRFPKTEKIYTGTFNLTNTQAEFVLPAAGGIGTKVFTVSGIAIIVTSVLFCGYGKREQKNRRGTKHQGQ